ncbi:chorismate-binding protein [Intrasporangium sp. DVR]|uniref:chorismate-binding protein n=1 Tax=Intrasporangium sp. DVR TaxID=3127867 RepID=UPI00313A5C9E
MDHARFPDRSARGVSDIRRGDDALEAVSGGGFWALVATFEGEVTAIRFRDVQRLDGARRPAARAVDWAPLDRHWQSSLSPAAYVEAVKEVRRRIAAGTVYQVNVCRVLSHPLAEDADLDGLDGLLRQGNPAPHAARIRCAEAGVDVVSASPELFLARRGGRLVTRPIKGTAPTPEQMLPKDHAENVMIVDLMRNDLSAVCEPGTVSVDELCAFERHPGLVHLVSTVSGRVREGVTWREIFRATFPPGSVSGAPKSSALTAIADLETAPRGPYCGAIGWIDADRAEAELAVGIRTFWADRDSEGARWLRFGTGAGITWHSDPEGEWAETELKAARLVGLAAGSVTP